MAKAIAITVGVVVLCYIAMYATLMFQVMEMLGVVHGH